MLAFRLFLIFMFVGCSSLEQTAIVDNVDKEVSLRESREDILETRQRELSLLFRLVRVQIENSSSKRKLLLEGESLVKGQALLKADLGKKRKLFKREELLEEGLELIEASKKKQRILFVYCRSRALCSSLKRTLQSFQLEFRNASYHSVEGPGFWGHFEGWWDLGVRPLILVRSRKSFDGLFFPWMRKQGASAKLTREVEINLFSMTGPDSELELKNLSM